MCTRPLCMAKHRCTILSNPSTETALAQPLSQRWRHSRTPWHPGLGVACLPGRADADVPRTRPTALPLAPRTGELSVHQGPLLGAPGSQDCVDSGGTGCTRPGPRGHTSPGQCQGEHGAGRGPDGSQAGPRGTTLPHTHPHGAAREAPHVHLADEEMGPGKWLSRETRGQCPVQGRLPLHLCCLCPPRCPVPGQLSHEPLVQGGRVSPSELHGWEPGGRWGSPVALPRGHTSSWWRRPRLSSSHASWAGVHAAAARSRSVCLDGSR